MTSKLVIFVLGMYDLDNMKNNGATVNPKLKSGYVCGLDDNQLPFRHPTEMTHPRAFTI